MASLPPPASGLQPHSPNDQTLPESCQAPGGAVEMKEGPQASTLGPEEPEVNQDRGTLTVIREDQQSDLIDPKTVLDAEKTYVSQDLIDDEGSDKENMETDHSQVATTKPPPLPPGALHRAPSEQRRVPKDTARVPPHTKAPQRTQDQAATNATVATEREAHERPSMRSAATQTHDSPAATGVLATPPRTNACTQTQEVEVMVAEEAGEAAAAAAPPTSGRSRGMVFSGSFPLPADPARLAERIRHNRSQ
ncbi:hypothetical protein CRUP_010266, partial [Coryphaenoides rupestris]